MIPQPFDQVPLLAGLSQEERELVTAHLSRRQVSSGEVIYAAGEPSEALYIILSGWVRLENAASRAAMLANLGPGSLLGEIDTLLGRPYTTSARASSPAQLQSLSRSDLQELIVQHPGIGLRLSASLGMKVAFLEQYLVTQRLRNIPLLSSLSDDDLRAIAQNLDFRPVARGELVIEAGTPGDTAYLIEEGHIRLISSSSEGESYEDLKPGDLFGHTALITGKSHSATARAVSDSTLWLLPNSVYQDIVRQHPAVKVAFSHTLAEALAPNDQVDAVERIRQLPFFAEVPTEALNALVSRLVLRHYPTNEVIYSEGTPGDAMYIVESGETKLLDSSAPNARLLERVHTGESFGEMALLTGRTRAECVRAASDTTIWVLYKSDFDELMVRYPEVSLSLSRALTDRLGAKENDFLVRHLRRIHLLSNLATSELRTISNKVKGLRFRPGEIICFAGQAADSLFMIEMGEVKRFGVGMSGEPVLIDLLGPGDSFGEQAIVQNSPYNATAQAIGELELWTISRDDFLSLMEQFPSLAMTVTRMMADRLTRSQAAPNIRPAPAPRQPQLARPVAQPRQPLPTQTRPMPAQPPRPRPAAPVNAPRVPPPVSVPPSPARIQRPPSGARPIRSVTPSSESARPALSPAQPRIAQPPVIENPRPPHKSELRTAPAPSRHHLDHHEIAKHSAQAVPVPTNGSAHKHGAPKQHRESSSIANELVHWATNLSTGAKLRILLIVGIFVWIALIAIPATAISTISSAFGGVQLPGPAPAASATRTQAAKQVMYAEPTGKPKVAIAAAIDTPVPPPPTRTPVPPTKPPTATRKPATATVPKPTNTPVPAIIAPMPTAQAQAAAATAIPALPPIVWDNRLGPNGIDKVAYPDLEGVHITPSSATHGQKFWRVISVKFEGLGESNNNHNVYVTVLDENGQRATGKTVSGVTNPEKSETDECHCQYIIDVYSGGAPDVTVQDQYPSETVAGMCLCGIPNVLRGHAHVNFRITFQLTTMP